MEPPIDYNLILKRIYHCILDNIRRDKNPEMNRELMHNLENATISLFHHLEKADVIDYNFYQVPPTKSIRQILKPIYHILIIFNNGKIASIINIPNIELTFRDHDISFSTITETTTTQEKVKYLKELYHYKNYKIENIYHMLERIRDSRLEQLKMDISYSNLLNKKKTEKRKFDTSSGITFSGLKSTNGFTFGFKPNSANAKYVMNHFMKS